MVVTGRHNWPIKLHPGIIGARRTCVNWILIALIASSIGGILFPCMHQQLIPTWSPYVTLSQNVSSYFAQFEQSPKNENLPQVLISIHEQEIILRNLSNSVANFSEIYMTNVPTVPCLSLGGHLLVLSASASRIRYGRSVTFFTVHPTEVKHVLPKTNSAKPLFSYQLNLWCVFDDGSITPTYNYYYKDPAQDVSVIDCPLSSFASDQLWKYNRTLRVYLFSVSSKEQQVPILKAYVTVPMSFASHSSNRQLLTLCTSPLHNKAKYLAQWIEFHRLVGFRKFVIYNTTDKDQKLSYVVNTINKKYPHMVDVVQWNFASLNLTDTCPTRYFQIQALNDCFIRYGDQSEWMGTLDLDEYLVPLNSHETVADYLHNKIGSHAIGSINLWSHFFCNRNPNKYTSKEKNEDLPVIERFTHRTKTSFKLGRQKYLYRPRLVQYLTIHYQIAGLSKEETSGKDIMLAHYVALERLRDMKSWGVKDYVNDTSVRDRFVEILKRELLK